MLAENAIHFILRLSIYHQQAWSNTKVHAISTSLDIRPWVWRHEKQGTNPQRFETRSVCKQLDQSTVQHAKDQSTYDSICMNHLKPNAWYSTEHSSQPKTLSHNTKNQNYVSTFPRRFLTLFSPHPPIMTLPQPSPQQPEHVKAAPVRWSNGIIALLPYTNSKGTLPVEAATILFNANSQKLICLTHTCSLLAYKIKLLRYLFDTVVVVLGLAICLWMMAGTKKAFSSHVRPKALPKYTC